MGATCLFILRRIFRQAQGERNWPANWSALLRETQTEHKKSLSKPPAFRFGHFTSLQCRSADVRLQSRQHEQATRYHCSELPLGVNFRRQQWFGVALRRSDLCLQFLAAYLWVALHVLHAEFYF